MPETWLARPPVLYALGATTILLVGYLDERTGYELSLSILYLVPVALVALRSSRAAAIVFAFLASLTWLGADLSARSFSRIGLVFWNGLVRLIFFLVVAVTLSRLQQLVRRERGLASTDHLTGVANSRRFYEILAHEGDRMRRTGRPISLAFIDLDDFKTVNDAVGHIEGDRLLHAVAAEIRSQVRTVDVVARLGGDEFAVLLPETPGREAQRSLERIRAALLERMSRDRWDVTFSIGVVTASSAPTRVEAFVKFADDVMYRAKNAGKNRLLADDYRE